MNSKFLQWLILILLVVILLAGFTWANVNFARISSGGTDFLVHWIGARALLRGETPYGDETALEIQKITYGRPALPGEHELRVAYPIYSALVFSPFALISDYVLARSLWMTFLEIALVGTFLLSLNVVEWRPGRVLLPILLLFSLLWYHAARPLINGNAVAVVALLFTATVWAIKNKRDELAGLFLALATLKPHLALLPVIWSLMWMIPQKRWRFTGWFFGSLVVMVLAGMILVPDWLLQNLREILRYTSYNPPTTIGTALETWFPGFGQPAGWLVSLLLGGLLLWEWKKALRAGFPGFLWAFALTLTVGQWIGITTDPGNFVILTLPLVMVLKPLYEMRQGPLITGITLGFLFVGLWALFLLTLPPGSNQQNPIMFFPLPLFLFIGLYIFGRKALPASPSGSDTLEH
jgi:hypothetical protein